MKIIINSESSDIGKYYSGLWAAKEFLDYNRNDLCGYRFENNTYVTVKKTKTGLSIYIEESNGTMC